MEYYIERFFSGDESKKIKKKIDKLIKSLSIHENISYGNYTVKLVSVNMFSITDTLNNFSKNYNL